MRLDAILQNLLPVDIYLHSLTNRMGRTHCDGDDGRNQNNDGQGVKSAAVITVCLAHMSDEKRAKGAGCSPGCEHESVDGTDVG